MIAAIVWGIPLLILVLRILGRKDPSLLLGSSIYCLLYGGFALGTFIVAEYSDSYTIDHGMVIYMAPFFAVLFCLGVLGMITTRKMLRA